MASFKTTLWMLVFLCMAVSRTTLAVPDKPSAKRQRVALVHAHAIATFAAATAATALVAGQNNTESPLQQYRKAIKRAQNRQVKAAGRAA
jgi:acyl-coenzyme A synthetase/AMP-(fatty) acid ligase